MFRFRRRGRRCRSLRYRCYRRLGRGRTLRRCTGRLLRNGRLGGGGLRSRLGYRRLGYRRLGCRRLGCRRLSGRRLGRGSFRRCLGTGLLGRLDGLGLLGLLGARQTVFFRAAAETVALRLDERRGVTLHSNAHLLAERHHLRIRHSELFCQLVHAHVLRQNSFQPFLDVGAPGATPTIDDSLMPASVMCVSVVCTSASATATESPRSRNASCGTEHFHDLSNALRRSAVWKHAIEHSHAPLPAARRPTRAPWGPTAQRTNSACGRDWRQPMQVLYGAADRVSDVVITRFGGRLIGIDLDVILDG